MRLPRITIRRLMIAIAVAEGLFWVGRMRSLSHSYLSRAYEHAWTESTDEGRYCSLFGFNFIIECDRGGLRPQPFRIR